MHPASNEGYNSPLWWTAIRCRQICQNSSPQNCEIVRPLEAEQLPILWIWLVEARISCIANTDLPHNPPTKDLFSLPPTTTTLQTPSPGSQPSWLEVKKQPKNLYHGWGTTMHNHNSQQLLECFTVGRAHCGDSKYSWQINRLSSSTVKHDISGLGRCNLWK